MLYQLLTAHKIQLHLLVKQNIILPNEHTYNPLISEEHALKYILIL